MLERDRLVIRPWMLPMIVAAIALPIAAGMILQGPALGLAIGALAATAIVVIAVRMRPDEPIEVVRSSDAKRHFLVVASRPVDDPGAVGQIAEAVGAREDSGDTEVLVLAPAHDRFLDRWASDVRPAREEAQRKLVLSVAALAAAEVDARGSVGDADIVQAVEDTLASFPATDVVLVTGPPEADPAGARAVAELRRRLDRPVRHLELGA
jgi:hypothetical protein